MVDEKTSDQIERIKKKLIIAKNTDKELKVFGASSHKYILSDTVKTADILEFEKDYKVSLPEDYKAFLTQIGNRGISYQDSAAGPGYGIFPLGKNVEEFICANPQKYLKEDCKLNPEMSDEFWKDLTKNIDENENLSEEDFNTESGKVYAGILPIGTQGCAYYYGLVLSGEFKGRIVNVDLDQQKPFFVFESNFLDWYERWLDEITSENEDKHDLFNYTLGGAVSHILDIYVTTEDEETKIECLSGILKKRNIDSKVLDFIEEKYKSSIGKIQKMLLQTLVKFDYKRAYPYLIDFAKKDLLSVFQFVFWYAKDRSSDWFEFIKENIEKIKEEETFELCTYLLKEMKLDYGSIIIPFTTNINEKIRVSAYYSLGLLRNKSEYLNTFILGLSDHSNRVVHTVLQALDGIEDPKLLKYYKLLAERFPTEQDYILANLNHRLKAYGLTNRTIRDINTDEQFQNNAKRKK